MNLHFFMDPFGHYSCHFAERLRQIDSTNNLIVNINEAKINDPRIIYFKNYNHELKNWIDEQKNIKRVYFHYHNPIFQEINKKFKKKNPAIISTWVFWGGDFYSLPEFNSAKYLKFSAQFSAGSYLQRSNKLRQIAVNIYYRSKGSVPYNHKKFIASFQNIDYLATTFENDFDNVIRYSGSKMKFVKFSYASLNQILINSDDLNHHELGNKIMVGHSADPGLNHFEILSQLKDLKCPNDILLPLNYGNQQYKKALLDAVNHYSLSLEILDQYLPIEEYNKKMLEVGFAIFNVNRQQAFGNIVTLVWMGAKVFLHEESSIYVEFKKLGIAVFSVNEIQRIEIFTPLSIPEKEKNKQILESYLSSDVVNEMTRDLLQLHTVNR